MVTFEQVEKLREKVNVSFEDAKAALELTDGDLLDAVIFLERSGKIDSPRMSAYNTHTGGVRGAYEEDHPGHPGQPRGPYWRNRRVRAERDESYEREYPRFRDHLRAFGGKIRELIRKGNANYFVASKGDNDYLNIPVTLLALAAMFFFWLTFPLLVIGLFCGCRYQFRGPDFKRDTVNNVMDHAARTAETIKRSVMAQAQAADNAQATDNARESDEDDILDITKFKVDDDPDDDDR